MTRLFRIAILGLVAAVAPAFAQVDCIQQAAGLPGIRSSGERELLAEVVVVCTGGTPTGAGQVVPVEFITLTLNTDVTSRELMSPWTEVLLLVDEPAPANQSVCGLPPCTILGTGTGMGTYSGTAGRPNVFVGQLEPPEGSGPDILTWEIPFDPPGSSGTRTFRIVNLRASGAAVGAGGAISATTFGFPTNSPLSTVGFVLNPFPGIQVTDQQSSGGALSGFKLSLTEAFPTVFKKRTTAGPGPADQNIPGVVSFVESGFRNSAFPVTGQGDVSQAGLADTGTRVMVRLFGLLGNVTLTVPTTINFGLGTGVARLIDTSGATGEDPYNPSATGVIVPDGEGLARIVYEFTQTGPAAVETLQIPITVNYGAGAPVLQQLNGEAGLAPTFGFDSSPVPEFDPSFFLAFQANAPAISITTSTLANGSAGIFYSQTVQATAGVQPYTFSLAMAGSLPPGLTLQTNGVLSGIPTQVGAFGFTVVVVDSQNNSATRTFLVQIDSSVEITTGSPLPPGTVGNPYSTTITAAGGLQPYTFDFNDSSPPGFSLSPGGVLSGMPSIAGTFQFAILAIDAAGGSSIRNFSLTVAPQDSIFQLSALQLEFTAAEGGAAPPVQSLTIHTQLQQAVDFTVSVDGGSPNLPAPGWLQVMVSNTGVPYRITVSADQGGLPAGTYNARILVGVAGNSAQPPLIAGVTLRVLALPPKLSVFPKVLKFERQITQPGTLSKTVQVFNEGGGGSVAFTASVVGNSPWIKAIVPAQGQAGTNHPTAVRVDVDTTGMPLGFHRGIVRFTWTGGTLDLPVVLFIAPAGPWMRLSSTGVYFRANAGVVSLQTRQVRILNLDHSSAISWTATVLRGDEWLDIAPPSGTSTASEPGVVTLSVKPSAANLPPGPQYALVRIDAQNTINAPQYLVGVLDIQGGATTSGLDFDSAGVVLIAPTGSTKVVTHVFNITTGSRNSVPLNASVSTAAGGKIFAVDPRIATVSSFQPAQLTLFAYPHGLGAGVYRGELAVSTATRVETLAVTLIVTDSVGGEALPVAARAAGGCVPSSLAATQVGLTNNFSVPAGWPTALVVDLRDNCGTQVLNGTVVADFSNGDPPLGLTGDGVSSLYSATWQPVAQVNPMAIVIHAQTPDLPQADLPLTGGIVSNAVPTLFQGGTVHNLDPKLGGPLSPGVVAQVYGTNLATVSEPTTEVPLTTLHKGTQMLIGPYEAPLYFVSPGQLNVQVPAELTPNLPYSVIVSVNGALTVPDTINVVPTVPGVAAFQDGRVIAQHNADFALVTDANPAKRDEFLILYLVGLGATNPPVASGAPSPGAEPLGRPVEPVTVTLGGQAVEVPFVGLTPFSVGLFQINMKVPANAPLNTPLDIVITQGGLSANVATLTVASLQ